MRIKISRNQALALRNHMRREINYREITIDIEGESVYVNFDIPEPGNRIGEVISGIPRSAENRGVRTSLMNLLRRVRQEERSS